MSDPMVFTFAEIRKAAEECGEVSDPDPGLIKAWLSISGTRS